MWMFYSWIADKKETHELFKDYGTYVGSFSNPEMAKQVWNSQNPQYSSTDEEYEQSIKNVQELDKQLAQTTKHRRHRRMKVLNK